jgi:uncharacterized RDD family membrane protein YckC
LEIVDGVFYSQSDYAGIIRRLAIVLIDSSFLIAVFILMYSSAPLMNMSERHIAGGFVLVTYLYLVILKRSKTRTIAYRLLDTRVVDLEGNAPSIWKMTLRYILLIGGPFHILADLLWLTGERDKQSIRDKFAATYVVRNKAQPIGRGKILVNLTDLFGYSLYLREVSR